MNTTDTVLRSVMDQAIETCTHHVNAGGLPFVGVVVNKAGQMLSRFGVNRVAETGDPMAHAEVVAMREAMATHGLDTLTGTVLLATGEPCGLCYRYAINHGIEAIYVAADRDEAAAYGFDYLASYPAFGVTDTRRDALLQPLPVARAIEPFTRYLTLHPSGRASPQPDTPPKGTPLS
ncbi:nucleoside deaminase [Nesterenkonia aerolata]|uniref:Nucleoside deaminase n=1 Tax=Nesterenkonia aerolata TaxID=3074079 RepID=A0ABU2DQP7_9MICC|nr:nucleoside deaminase [Nesterenkonia sp. LY-0111]MDR8018830.1 nucleoside deaminase [Nesterenkonia sp. LY-0111]